MMGRIVGGRRSRGGKRDRQRRCETGRFHLCLNLHAVHPGHLCGKLIVGAQRAGERLSYIGISESGRKGEKWREGEGIRGRGSVGERCGAWDGLCEGGRRRGVRERVLCREGGTGQSGNR